MQVLGVVLTILSYVLIAIMILTFRRIRSVSIKGPLIAIAISTIAIIVYAAIVGTSLPFYIVMIIMVFGLLLGLGQGNKTKVWLEKDNRKKAQNTIWFLVIWALCYGVNQTLVVLGQSLSLSIGFGGMSLGTGVTLGTQAIILYKLIKLNGDIVCPNCGERNAKGLLFCVHCGKALAAPVETADRPIGPDSMVCPNCNTQNAKGMKFCIHCGKPLKSR
ncbi:MAG: zinc ribbon domain-containing protein [Dehalococcoidales bacterium]|nr:zinc ribbon domain-containing protein [Dehalococcoidales bacterium]